MQREREGKLPPSEPIKSWEGGLALGAERVVRGSSESVVERSLQGKPNMVATTSRGVLRTVLPINACTGGQYSGTGNLPLRSSAL